MNTFEIVILAMALVFNSWISYLNAGIMLASKPVARKIYYTGTTFILQAVMDGVGIWIGYKLGSPEIKVNMMISFSILLIFGLRVLLAGIRIPLQENAFDYTDNKVVFLSALAEGITPLAIGIAIGLLSVHQYLDWMVIDVFLFTGIIAGLIVSKRLGSGSLKLRLGPISGLLLLAAAIKLMLNITGF